MNPQDADRQIEQMIAFIAQEAREKAEEIQVKTEKEFQADKLSLEVQAAAAVRNEADKRRKDWITQKKIEKSKQLTDARFSTMKARDAKMNELKAEVAFKLAEVATSPKYKELIKFLIAQGLMTLMENHVNIQCRKEDLSIVKAQLDAGIKLFQDTMKEATSGVVPSVNVVLDEKTFLPPAPVKGSSALACSGGILLTARQGQIVCRNTLDHRLDLAFESLKPSIRGALFGVRAKIENAAPVERHGVSLPK